MKASSGPARLQLPIVSSRPCHRDASFGHLLASMLTVLRRFRCQRCCRSPQTVTGCRDLHFHRSHPAHLQSCQGLVRGVVRPQWPVRREPPQQHSPLRPSRQLVHHRHLGQNRLDRREPLCRLVGAPCPQETHPCSSCRSCRFCGRLLACRCVVSCTRRGSPCSRSWLHAHRPSTS